MGYHFYVATQATKQGQFKGGSVRKGWKDGLEVHSFAFGVEVPLDVNQGIASGKRQHSPITIKKPVDIASPQLFQSLVTNEVLKDVKIHYWEPPPSGKEVVVPTVHLTQATVSGATRYAPNLSANPQPSGENITPTIHLTNATIVSIKPVAVPGAQGPCEQVELSPELIERIRDFPK